MKTIENKNQHGFRVHPRKITHLNTWRTSVNRILALLAFALVANGNVLMAAAPKAGMTIGNQASATYTDDSNTKRTTTSNVAVTMVQQVASFTLTADNTKNGAVGGQISFPHTIVNTGNGTDSFDLTLQNLPGDNFDYFGLAIYADANGDGLADNATPIANTSDLESGASFQFVVVGTIPASATAGEVGKMSITAVNTFDGSQTLVNTDTANVTANAVVNVSKSINVGSGPSPSGPHTYTLTFQNTGNTSATNLTITDLVPAGMTYVADSARWSVTGNTVLTDANSLDTQGSGANTILYDYGVAAPGQVTATIATLAPGQSGTVSFQVNINAGVEPGQISNTAGFSYNDGAGNVGPFVSNPALFTVLQTASLTMSGDTVASISQGGTVTFTNLLTNTGNGTDTFDIRIDASSYPAGSTYAILQQDGNTPMIDSNGDSVPDTGPLAPGATYDVVVQVSLPPDITGGGPYSLTKSATSASDPAQSATADDVLTTIAPNTVDLSNDAAGTGAPGFGNTGANTGNGQPEGAAVKINATDPDSTTRFTLYANNTSSSSDNYAIAASTNSSFSTIGLPLGWSAVFRDANEAVITSTGILPGGADRVFYADVTVPAGEVPGTTDIYFRLLSPTTGASDRKHDAVTVNTIRELSLSPNNSGQVFPGGSVVYSHTLKNLGNVVEGDGADSTVSLTVVNSQAGVGYNSVIYHDANANGVLDAADPVLSNLNGLGGIAPDASVGLLLKVLAPAGATAGSVDVATLTATTVNGNYATTVPAAVSSTDRTTVISGDLTILKEQALDADNDGIADGPFTTQPITSGAKPGLCIIYRLTVQNTGSADATSVVVSDTTPTFTTYDATSAATTSQGTIDAPANGAAGTITATLGTMTPGQTVIVTFGVKINN